MSDRIGHAVGRAGGAVQDVRSRRRLAAAARRAADAGRHTVVDHRKRLIVVLAVLASLFALLASKVVDLQVVSPDRYLSFGAAQRTDTQVLPAARGSILDRNGAELVISRPTKAVFVDPALITDAPAEAAQVAPLLGLDVAKVQVAMTSKSRFAYLKRGVELEDADKVAALALPGVAFLDESERYLPGDTSARSLLGAVDTDGKGMSGLEGEYDQLLGGTPGSLTLEKNPDGNTIAVGEHNLVPAQPGQDLTLTIDRAIQHEAETALTDQVLASNAKGGIAIVTKPGTGEVLAMANVVKDEETGEISIGTNNAALTSQYEPGSVMKPVTVATALEKGVVTPTTPFDLPPTLRVYDADIVEAEPRGFVRWDVAKILEQSSNVGTAKIAERIGDDDAMYETQKAFGFGEKTALDFPNEAPGAVLAPSKWSGTSRPTIAIGQGIAVTPMQMLMAYNVIANQGVYVAPKLVQSTTDADGVVHPTAAGESRRVVTQTTADQLNLMLRSVVDEGTGQLAKIDGYHTFGKTGTAKKRQESGKYTDEFGYNQYQSTFIGVVPAEQPALSVYVMIDEPKGEYTGGTTAAPAFSKIASFALRRLGIPPAATDQAQGGLPVQADGGSTVGVKTVNEDGRVQAAAVGSPEANPVPSTVPPAGVTPTTTAPARGKR